MERLGEGLEQELRRFGATGSMAAIVAAGIAVMGHIGLLPQSVEKDGGYKIKGRTEENVAALVRDARAVEEAGAFSVVIEGTVETVGGPNAEARRRGFYAGAAQARSEMVDR